LKLACVAGETSGDLLGASVLRGLKESSGKQPNEVLAMFGIGGPAMQAEGLDALWTIDALSVRGYVEVIGALPRLLWMRHQLKQKIIAQKPDLFLGIDAPDFNLGLETRLKRAGIKTAHFISPSVWAWRSERLKHIGKAVDHMLLVFPMEKKIYAEAGIPASFVGHPMADEIPLTPDVLGARQTLGVNPEAIVIAVLPGSRKSEIDYLIPPFLETIKLVHRSRREVQFLMPAANPALKARIEAKINNAKLSADIDLRVLNGQARLCLEACNTALIASGTASLETALLKKPMVISYKMPKLSWARVRDMNYLPYVGLPNILCGGWIVPEFIQENALPMPMAQALLQQLDSASFQSEIAERFHGLHLSLRQGCAQKSADKLRELAESK
jgi:lipid-A-disaccharide synthase